MVIQYKSLVYYDKPISYWYSVRRKRTNLLHTYKLFEGYDVIYDYFLRIKGGTKDQFNVISITNLFSLLGFNTIILSKMGEKLKNKDGTADIIAYDSRTKNLILIDCTTAVKLSDKINTMLNLIDDVKDKINFIPVIITTKIISSYDIEAAKNNKIIIITKKKIYNILGLIYKDEMYKARTKIINILTQETFLHEDDYAGENF